MTTNSYIYRPDEDGLGLTAKHYRLIKPGSEYDRYFPRPSYENIFIGDRTTFEALDEIKKIVTETLHQTKAITEVLYDSDPHKFCKNVWEFMYAHYQYKMDAKGKEELREPARAWADRKTGIDCDCYAITVLSILINGGLNPLARIVELNNKGYYQHIYVIVPKQKNADANPWTSNDRYWTIDPVLDKFNLEPEKITFYKDFDMASPTYRLAGLGENDFDNELGCACQDAQPPMNLGELGKPKPFKKIAQAAKKVVVTTANGTKAVAMKVPAKAVAATKKAVANTAKKPLQRPATPGQKTVVKTPSGGQAVVLKVPAKAVAATKQAVANTAKKPLQRPATPGQKTVVKTPSGGQAVIMKVQPKTAPSLQIQENQKSELRDKIAKHMGLTPTPQQKVFFNLSFSFTDTIRINNFIPSVIKHGQDKLHPEDRILYQRAFFILSGKPIDNKTGENPGNIVTVIPTNNTPVRTTSPSPAPNMQVASFTTPSNFVDTNNPQDNVFEETPAEPGFAAKKPGSGLLVVAALGLAGVVYLATGSKKSKPLNGTEEALDIDHEVIETKPLNGPGKAKKNKTIPQLKIK